MHATTLAIGFRLLIYQTSMYCITSSDVPLQPVNMRTSNSISIDWQPEYKDVCFIVVSYEVEILQDGRPTVLIMNNDTSITIEELVPNTTYVIAIRVVSGTVKSSPVQVIVTTLSEYLLL